MTDQITVDVTESFDGARKPDYDGSYQNAVYHDDGTVTIEPLPDQS